MKLPGKDTVEMAKTFAHIGKNQSENVRIQVQEILKQTVLMERWAVAAERIASALDKISDVYEEKPEEKKSAENNV